MAIAQVKWVWLWEYQQVYSQIKWKQKYDRLYLIKSQPAFKNSYIAVKTAWMYGDFNSIYGLFDIWDKKLIFPMKQLNADL